MAAPMRPHVRRMGRVNVVTPGGWADVFEGGSALGPTPVQLELAAGLHRLRLVAAGGTERTVAVRVRPDEVVPLVVAIDTAGVETRAEGDQVVATQTE